MVKMLIDNFYIDLDLWYDYKIEYHLRYKKIKKCTSFIFVCYKNYIKIVELLLNKDPMLIEQ